MTTGQQVAPAGRHVVFSLGGVDYAVAASQVRHSLPVGRPAGPEVAFLGQSYPLVELRRLFRLAPSAAPNQLVLLVEADGRRAGLAVDGLVNLVVVEDAAIVPLPAVFRGVERRWFAGLVRLAGRVVVIVRVDGILGAREGLLPRSATARAATAGA